MLSLNTALDLLTKDCWMASVDLTDTYYSVPIVEKDKFMRFVWGDNIYEYQVLPNGLSPGPRLFTKLLKPIYGKMGELGHICFLYIDDSFLLATSKIDCEAAVLQLTDLFTRLGFQINKEKSQLEPDTKLNFPFDINSQEMFVSHTGEKKMKLVTVIQELAIKNEPSIREVAGLIGLMVGYTPGIEYSGAHFKALESDKIRALRRTKGDFDSQMWISEEGLQDISWWWNNVENS